jgi:hypothetical protein
VRGNLPLLSFALALSAVGLRQFGLFALAGGELCCVITFDSSTAVAAAVAFCSAGRMLGCTALPPLSAHARAHFYAPSPDDPGE